MTAISSWIGGTRRLVVDVGQYGLMLGPVRRAFLEPAAAARDELLRVLLCYYGRRLWESGMIAGKCGNLSARLGEGDQIYITPRGANKSRLNATEIQRAPLDIDHSGALEEVSVEFPMHRACYLADRRVGAVIHTHAPALTALGIRRAEAELERSLPEAALAVGGVRRVPYLSSGSEALGSAVARAVSDGASLLILERHGALAVGATLSEACDRMEFGELSARTVLLSAAR